MRFPLLEGIIVASTFAFLETLFGYGTGRLSFGDWPIYFGVGFTFWVVIALLFAAAGHRLFEQRWFVPGIQLALLVAPALLWTVRGNAAPALQDRAWVPIVRWGVGLLILAACARQVRMFPNGLAARRFIVLSTTSQALALLDFLSRTTDFEPLLDLRGWPGLFLVTASISLYTLPLVELGRRWGVAPPRVNAPNRWKIATAAGLWSAMAACLSAAALAEKPDRVAYGSGAAKSGGPNVLLIVLDTVRKDHLSAYGYSRQTTPNLDAFARKAWRFDNAYATAPYTLSSHASVFTGQLPREHGARRRSFAAWSGPSRLPPGVTDIPLSAESVTLAEDLRTRGYATAGIVANTIYLQPWTGLDQGFDHYDSRHGRTYGYVPIALPLVKRLGLAGATERLDYRVQRSARTIIDQAIDWLASNRGKFFLFLNLMDAHFPYEVPAPIGEKSFAPASDIGSVQKGLRSLSPSEHDALVQGYDSSIEFMDRELQRLFSVLDTRGALQDTIVIVTSDHGELFGEHGLLFHSHSVYEEVLRVPLLIKAPNVEAAVLSDRTSLADLRGWLLDTIDGKDPNPPGSQPEKPRMLAEFWYNDPRRFGVPYQRAVYGDNFKIIQSAHRIELFNLGRDPGELTDLADTSTGEAITRRLLAQVPELAFQPSRRPSHVLSREAEERLRALGYIQ